MAQFSESAPAVNGTEWLTDPAVDTAAQAATRAFEGAGHNETDWGARLDEPLLFLMAVQ